MTDYEKVEMLVEDLLEDYDREDPDYKAAEPFLSKIKEYYTDYSYSDLCTWLVEHNGDILINFKNADIVSEDDYKNSDDWEKAKKNAFLVSDDGTAAVMSW